MEQIHFDRLTDTERKTLRLYWTARTYDEVAAIRRLSPHTIDGHLDQIRYKLGVGSSLRAAYLFALHEGRASEHDLEGAGVRGGPRPGLPSASSAAEYSMSSGPAYRPAAEVREASTGAGVGLGISRWESGDDRSQLNPEWTAVFRRVVRAAEMIALVLLLAWLTVLIINGLEPGFFRILDNLHS